MTVLRFSIENDIVYNECGIMKSDKPWMHLPRKFKMWVLGICTSGIMYMNIEGTEYRIMPGDIFLLPVAKLHWGTRMSEGIISYYWIHFEAPPIDDMLCGDTAQAVKKREPAQNISEGSPCDSARSTSASECPLEIPADQAYLMLHSSLLDIEPVSAICGQLYAISFAQYYTRNIQQSLLKALLYEISNQTLLSHAHKFDQKFVKLLNHIQENFLSDISIDVLSEKFGYNKHYLCRTFKQRTGKTITTYYTQLRICLACQQLSETNYPIKRIARECGYESEKYFMRIFKAHMGMTPSQYRNSHMIAVISE